jgi:hypothetical protein
MIHAEADTSSILVSTPAATLPEDIIHNTPTIAVTETPVIHSVEIVATAENALAISTPVIPVAQPIVETPTISSVSIAPQAVTSSSQAPVVSENSSIFDSIMR